MINKIIPFVLVIVAVGGAGFAAMTLKGSGPAKPVDPLADGEEVYDVENEKKGPSVGYFDFQRNFLVPVVRGQSIRSIVLLTISVEMEETSIEEARSREPRIRDAFMKALLEMSYEGVFDQDITNPEVYETVQKTLSAISREIIHESAKSVLIIDFGRQDQ